MVGPLIHTQPDFSISDAFGKDQIASKQFLTWSPQQHNHHHVNSRRSEKLHLPRAQKEKYEAAPQKWVIYYSISGFTFFFYAKWYLKWRTHIYDRYPRWYMTGQPLILPCEKEKACASSLLSEWGWVLRLSCPKPAIFETRLCLCTRNMETDKRETQSCNK